MPHPTCFTLDEARAILPFLEENIKKLLRAHKALEILNGIQIENDVGDPELDVLITKLNVNYYKKLYLYNKYMGRLLGSGVQVKDLNMGLIDLYSKHDGRLIFLCWRLGEKDVMYWHEIGDCFRDRKPITLLEQNF